MVIMIVIDIIVWFFLLVKMNGSIYIKLCFMFFLLILVKLIILYKNINVLEIFCFVVW